MDAPRETAAMVLDELGIAHLADQRVESLSSGQGTLVGFAKAVIHRPRLVVLDEPTASLDPDVAMRVRDRLEAMNAEHETTLLLTSHDMREVERLTTRVIFLRAGTHHRRRSRREGRGGRRLSRPRDRCSWPRRRGCGRSRCDQSVPSPRRRHRPPEPPRAESGSRPLVPPARPAAGRRHPVRIDRGGVRRGRGPGHVPRHRHHAVPPHLAADPGRFVRSARGGVDPEPDEPDRHPLDRAGVPQGAGSGRADPDRSCRSR